MKAKDLKMEELLSFRPHEGMILLKNTRALIFYADALGTLRKDLITTLGMDRAKGFLIRYGWSCGYNAAMSIKEKFTWDNDLEWIYAGPVMHTLEGVALVVPDKIEIKGEWLLSGKWIRSFEAEQHIKYFGVHTEPVCWMLVGYAGGYGSAYLGKKVVYKEVKCVGCGDEVCSFIGRTVEEWGDEIVPELPYYEVTKINEELEDAHSRIKSQHYILKKAVSIHEQLTQRVLKGEGIDTITNTLALLMNCSVVVETPSLRILSRFSPFEPDPNLSGSDVKGTSPQLFNDPGMENERKILMEEHQTLPLTLTGKDGSKEYRLIAPILVGQDILGYVSIIRHQDEFKEVDFIAIEHAATVFALELMKQKEIAEVERKLRGDFLDDLLTGNYDTPDSIINRAKCFNYDIFAPHRVLVIDIDNFSRIVYKYKNDEKQILKFKTTILEAINSAARDLGTQYISAGKSDNIIILVGCPAGTGEEPVFQWAKAVKDKVCQRFSDITVSIGIGKECLVLEDYRNSYIEAKKALDIIRTYNKKNQIVSLARLGAHSVIFHAANKAELAQFTARTLGGLLEYDKSHGSELLHTLRAFLENNGNIEKTAKTSNMSVSGLKYRLQRIEEISQIQLDDAQSRFNLQLALKILDVTGEELFGV